MKKNMMNEEDKQWFDEQFGEAINRFDAAHSPDVPELAAFEQLVQTHKRNLRSGLWKELALFWLTACLIFSGMMWVVESNWMWFAALQAVIAICGAGYAGLAFGRKAWREWRS